MSIKTVMLLFSAAIVTMGFNPTCNSFRRCNSHSIKSRGRYLHLRASDLATEYDFIESKLMEMERAVTSTPAENQIRFIDDLIMKMHSSKLLNPLQSFLLRFYEKANGIGILGNSFDKKFDFLSGTHLDQYDELTEKLKVFLDQFSTIDLGESDFSQTSKLAVVGIFSALSAILLFSVNNEKEQATIPTKFDLKLLNAYYARRPITLVMRLLYIASKILTFAVSVWIDLRTGKWDTNMPTRAAEIRKLLQTTGPAYIKLGQGVSIRPDILPEIYLNELQKLQDQVPPFSSDIARQIIETELGSSLEDIFTDVDAFSKPIAAASLGQVYKARLLKDGTTVAVKVQRPNVLESVTLDLYVTRIILIALSYYRPARDSVLAFLALIDNWGVRFLDELDYYQEAKNGERFRKEMSKSDELGSAILVPKVYTEYNTRYILVSQWVEGERVSNIDVDAPGGRQRLEKIVATLLNAYLTQMLDSGFLHADPHPGNFLCTPDGKLCILDFGLMTEVTQEQRYAILEYVSHLIARDYEATLNDLITLGFIPKEIGEDPEKAALVAPLIGSVLGQLTDGGGAKAVTVETVGEEIEELGKQYPIIIPAYFGLIFRAFSALEGIGLQLDPKYSIVKECFPYLARRLLTEDTPRMQRMLRSFLYGGNGTALRVDRVDELVAGYRTFTSLADEASKGVGGIIPLKERKYVPVDAAFMQRNGNRGDIITVETSTSSSDSKVDFLADPVARDALKLLFSKDGNYVQDLIVEELVRMTDALGREVNLQLLQALRSVSESSLSPLSLLRSVASTPLNPFLAPIQLLSRLQIVAFDRITTRLEVALELTSDDQEAINTLRRLIEIFQDAAAKGQEKKGYAGANSGAITARTLRELTRNGAKEIIDAARSLAGVYTLVAPGARNMTERYFTQLLSRALKRLAENIEDVPGSTLLSPSNQLPPPSLLDTNKK